MTESPVIPAEGYRPGATSIRSLVEPVVQRPQIAVEPTPLYKQKKESVFKDKFTDRSPQIPPAAKIDGAEEEDVKKLMGVAPEPDRPPNIKKFHDYYFTPYEQRRIHYGQVNDPERQIALDRVHGVPSKQFDTSGELLNPPTKSLVQYHLDNIREGTIYASSKKPLGKVPHPNLPEGLDPNSHTFGASSKKGDKAGEIVNPNKPYAQVEWEGEQCKDMYRFSHSAYHPGEQKKRDYPCFDNEKKFGYPTPNDPRGTHARKALDWLTDCLDRKGARFESERHMNYKERYAHQLGKVRDPIADTMRVDPLCHTFGITSKGDNYTAGEIIHQRVPKEWLHNHWNRRNAVISEVRRQLKKFLWSDFEQFINICLQRDNENVGSLSTAEIRDIFKSLHVPLEPEVLEQLLDLCDVGVCNGSSDECDPSKPLLGRIDYRQLICVMNWTDRTIGNASSGACNRHNVNDPSNLQKLEKKIDLSVTDYRKTSATYGANHDVDTTQLRRFGVPSRRNDLPAPRLRKLDDRQNYGDEPSSYSLISPSILAKHGLSERDVFMPRSRKEIMTILAHIGVDMNEEDFDAIWERAQDVQQNGGRQPVDFKHNVARNGFEPETVSLEAFRAVLDEIMARKVMNGEVLV